jgi:hypothetical protein
MDDIFRQTLTEITTADLPNQEHMIRKLVESHPHTITLRQAMPSLERSPKQYNCFMYAFDMAEDTTVQRIMEWLNPRTFKRDAYPSSKFACYLLEHSILSRTKNCDEEEGIIMYFLDAVPKHAGRIKAGRVTSKWGLGHLWEHGIYEVPSTFGHETRCFKTLTRQESVFAYISYAKQLGWPG